MGEFRWGPSIQMTTDEPFTDRSLNLSSRKANHLRSLVSAVDEQPLRGTVWQNLPIGGPDTVVPRANVTSPGANASRLTCFRFSLTCRQFQWNRFRRAELDVRHHNQDANQSDGLDCGNVFAVCMTPQNGPDGNQVRRHCGE
jgi:hypothetical protein